MQDRLKWVYIREIKPEINYFFLLGVVFIFSLLRLPSLVEPDWYGDEGIYQVIGRALNQGRLLYSEIWDNKPPVLYLYYALVNGDLFLIRLLALLFGIASVIVFYLLSSALFQRKRLPTFVSTFAFSVLFGLPLIEGNIANAENFILFPVILSLYIVTRLKSKSSAILPISSGLLLSIAFLTKIVALFDLSAFLVILFALRFYNKPLVDVKAHVLASTKQFVRVLKQEIILIVSFISPIILTSLYFLFRDSFRDFIKATFSQNIGYIGYANLLNLNLGSVNLQIPQGALILKILFLILGVAIIIRYRRNFGVAGLTIYTWLLFGIFSALFSGRPYTHYVLVLLPALSLLIGLIFYKRKRLLIHAIVAIILVAFLRVNFTYFTRILPYYENYISFVLNGKPIEQYQSFFDKQTPRNYEIARFISLTTRDDETVFMLSDSSTIYYLADKLPPGRYIVEYHISSYEGGVEETKKALEKIKPKYIISTKPNLLNNFVGNYVKRYVIRDVVIYERQI